MPTILIRCTGQMVVEEQSCIRRVLAALEKRRDEIDQDVVKLEQVLRRLEAAKVCHG